MYAFHSMASPLYCAFSAPILVPLNSSTSTSPQLSLHRNFLSSIISHRSSLIRSTNLSFSMSSSPSHSTPTLPISRRSVLQVLLSTALLFSSASPTANPAFAADSSTLYKNSVDLYEVSTPPSNWEFKEGSLPGGRKLIAWIEPALDGNITIVATPIASDFQKLTSFGTIDAVANTIIPPGKGLNGKMIRADSTKVEVDGSKQLAYVFEYELKPSSNKEMRHLWTLFCLRPGQNIITITAQCPAVEESQLKVLPVFNQMAESFKIL